MPSGDDENCLAVLHDSDNDLVVKRKKNEFIEIGKKINKKTIENLNFFLFY